MVLEYLHCLHIYKACFTCFHSIASVLKISSDLGYFRDFSSDIFAVHRIMMSVSSSAGYEHDCISLGEGFQVISTFLANEISQYNK